MLQLATGVGCGIVLACAPHRVLLIIVLGASKAHADRIRVAVQKTGTLAWELDVVKRHGIDRKLNLTIDTVELASTEAGKLALKGGSADLILSDWLWVARERSLGDTLVFYPTSSALGAVIAIGLAMGRSRLANRLGDPWLIVLLNLPPW